LWEAVLFFALFKKKFLFKLAQYGKYLLRLLNFWHDQNITIRRDQIFLEKDQKKKNNKQTDNFLLNKMEL